MSNALLERAENLLSRATTALERVEAENAELRAPVQKARPPAAATVPAEPADPNEAARWGFKSLGHFMHEVRQCPNPTTPSEVIRKAYSSDVVRKAALGMGELIGSDGGFLVPPGFSTKIFERVYNEVSLISKTDKYPIAGNSMTFPRNAESSRADGSRWGGVRSYWVQEGSTITASQPTFGRLTLNLHKLATLVPLTSELKQDAGVSLEAYLNKVFTSEISFETGKAIYRGNGAGRPLGMINAPCAISVSKELGQPAATVLHENIIKMWARRFALGPTGQYMWLVNQDVGPQLNAMNLPVGTGGQLTYLPPGGLSAAPYATLMGAPVMEIEWASTLGTVGDIALVDPSQYVTATSSGGPMTMSSLHVYFTTDQEAIRTTWRVDGQPWWASALTPFQGTNTQSPIVLLESR